MKIDKDYKDILGKIENKGCLEFTLDSKLRELSRQIPDNICGVYMFVEEMENEDNKEEGRGILLYMRQEGRGIMEILNHIKFKNHNMQHQHQIYLVQEIIMKKQMKTQDMGLEQQKVS